MVTLLRLRSSLRTESACLSCSSVNGVDGSKSFSKDPLKDARSANEKNVSKGGRSRSSLRSVEDSCGGGLRSSDSSSDLASSKADSVTEWDGDKDVVREAGASRISEKDGAPAAVPDMVNHGRNNNKGLLIHGFRKLLAGGSGFITFSSAS